MGGRGGCDIPLNPVTCAGLSEGEEQTLVRTVFTTSPGATREEAAPDDVQVLAILLVLQQGPAESSTFLKKYTTSF